MKLQWVTVCETCLRKGSENDALKLSDYQRAEAVQRRRAGESLTAIAKSYGVAISMISRL
jgi:hypothetical protein